MAIYCYIDFLVKSFDIKSKTSRKTFWVVLLINAALSVILVSIGLAIPQGRPLRIYIGISSIIAIPLFIPFFTIFARRLNDIGYSRKWLLLFLVPVIGFLALLVFCTFKAKENVDYDYSAYENGAVINAAKKIINSILTFFPFVYLAFTVYKLATATDSVDIGINASLLAFTLLVCIFTIIELKTKRCGRLLGAWKAIKKITSLSGAMLSIILYHGSQNFMDAIALVYFYFYVMVIPLIIIYDIYKLCKKEKKTRQKQ